MASQAPPLHELTTEQLLAELRVADADSVVAAHAAHEPLAHAIDALVESWPRGGRLIYVGAGTSGRIGALDAAECGPTFGVAADRVMAVIAGGPGALTGALEGAEDDDDAGRAAIADLGVGDADVVIALSASGATPFTCAALEEAVSRGAVGVAVTCVASSALAAGASIPIVIATGAEVVEGSTRLKAGTAQKLVCNAISTAAFIRLGRVWDRRMVAVQAVSGKLRRRAASILEELAGCAPEAASDLLASAGGVLPTAIVMARTGVDRGVAELLLERAHGNVHEAIARARGNGDGAS